MLPKQHKEPECSEHRLFQGGYSSPGLNVQSSRGLSSISKNNIKVRAILKSVLGFGLLLRSLRVWLNNFSYTPSPLQLLPLLEDRVQSRKIIHTPSEKDRAPCGLKCAGPRCGLHHCPPHPPKDWPFRRNPPRLLGHQGDGHVGEDTE